MCQAFLVCVFASCDVLVSYIETLLALVCGHPQVNSVFCKDKLLGWHSFFENCYCYWTGWSIVSFNLRTYFYLAIF
jgi:hypothetical protein